MKNIFYVISIVILLTQNAISLTRADVQIIEARENIQYLGQKITTDYFRLHIRPNDLALQNKFIENIDELKYNITELINNIKNITNPTKKRNIMTVLHFYTYKLDFLKTITVEPPTKEHARTLLSLSEQFLEGAKSIEKQYHYESSKEETMLVLCKELQYLIESVSKYYMAFQIGFKDKEHTLQMEKAIYDINKNLKKLQKYNYNKRLKGTLQQIIAIWNHNQHFFIYLEETTFPNLLLSSNSQIKELLIELEKYHKQHL